MADDPGPDPDDLGERLARLEGIVEAEDKLLERGLEGSNKVQVLIVGVIGLIVAASIAMLVYVLQRLDSIAMAAHH